MKKIFIFLVLLLAIVNVAVADEENETMDLPNLYDMYHATPEEQEKIYNEVMSLDDGSILAGCQVIEESISPIYMYNYTYDNNGKIDIEALKSLDLSDKSTYTKCYYVELKCPYAGSNCGMYETHIYNPEKKNFESIGADILWLSAYKEVDKMIGSYMINRGEEVTDCFLAHILNARRNRCFVVVTKNDTYFWENPTIYDRDPIPGSYANPEGKLDENMPLDFSVHEEMIEALINNANNVNEDFERSKRQWEIEHPGEPYSGGAGGIGVNSGNVITPESKPQTEKQFNTKFNIIFISVIAGVIALIAVFQLIKRKK